MRSIEKIGELEEEIKENLLEILCRLNREEGKLEELLTLLGIEENETVYKTSRSGKIIVIGDSKVPEWFLLAVARDLGLSKARFEFELDYATAEKYDFKKHNGKENIVRFCSVQYRIAGKQKEIGTALFLVWKTKRAFRL